MDTFASTGAKRLIATELIGLAALSFSVLGCARDDGRVDVSEVAVVRQAVVQPQSVSISVTAGLDYRAVAVAATAGLTISDRAQLLGTSAGTFAASSNTGTAISSYGNGAMVGEVMSIGNVTLGNPITVTGAIKSAGTVTGAPPGVPVSQGQNILTSTYTWTVPFDSSTTNVDLSSGTRTLNPGSYRRIAINGGTLVLNPGTYYVDALTLQSGSSLVINNAAAPVFVYVKSSLAFRTKLTSAPQNLLLGYFATTPIAIETVFKGTLIAPHAAVRFGVGGMPHAGSVFAKSVIVDPDVKFSQQAFSHWDLVPFNPGVKPTLNCVAQLDATTYGALFGYENTTGTPIKLGAGAHNRVSPNGPDRLQPILFVPGQVPVASFQLFTAGSQVSWTIGEQSAVATSNSPACSPSLTTALTQLHGASTDALTIQDSVRTMISNSRFATLVAHVKAAAGNRMTPFRSAMFDAVELLIANADLLNDESKLTPAQKTRLTAFRAQLLANPAIARLRLAGDLMRGDAGALQCDALTFVNRTQPLVPAFPVQSGSVFSDTLNVVKLPALSSARSVLASVANGPEAASLLSASGLALAGLQSVDNLSALTLDGPIPTGFWDDAFDVVVSVAAGAVTGLIGGCIAGGPAGCVAGAVGGAIVGGVVGIAAVYAENSTECRSCTQSYQCGDIVGPSCVSGCCADPDETMFGFSIDFLTAGGCPGGASTCQVNADCGGGLVCSQACCVAPQSVAGLCPYDDCASDLDCTGGNKCYSGCCVNRCGVDGRVCAEVPASACGVEPATCDAGQDCVNGCCVTPEPPGPILT